MSTHSPSHCKAKHLVEPVIESYRVCYISEIECDTCRGGIRVHFESVVSGSSESEVLLVGLLYARVRSSVNKGFLVLRSLPWIGLDSGYGHSKAPVDLMMLLAQSSCRYGSHLCSLPMLISGDSG